MQIFTVYSKITFCTNFSTLTIHPNPTVTPLSCVYPEPNPLSIFVALVYPLQVRVQRLRSAFQYISVVSMSLCPLAHLIRGSAIAEELRALCQLKCCQLLHCTKKIHFKRLEVHVNVLDDRSPSSKLPLFDRPYITSYQWSVVTTSLLSCIVSDMMR